MTTILTDDEFASLRELAEFHMLTTCEIQYATDRAYSDPVTGSETPIYETDFQTKCRVKTRGGLSVREGEVGGRTSAEVVRELQIPVGSAEVRANASALITAVHPTDDPTLLGARLELSGPAPGSQTTKRRLEVTEVVA